MIVMSKLNAKLLQQLNDIKETKSKDGASPTRHQESAHRHQRSHLHICIPMFVCVCVRLQEKEL